MVRIFGDVIRSIIRLVTVSVECVTILTILKSILTVLLKPVFVLNTKFGGLIVAADIKLFIFIAINPPKMFTIIHARQIRIENGGVVATTEITTQFEFDCLVNDIELNFGFCKTNVFCRPNNFLNKFTSVRGPKLGCSQVG